MKRITKRAFKTSFFKCKEQGQIELPKPKVKWKYASVTWFASMFHIYFVGSNCLHESYHCFSGSTSSLKKGPLTLPAFPEYEYHLSQLMPLCVPGTTASAQPTRQGEAELQTRSILFNNVYPEAMRVPVAISCFRFFSHWYMHYSNIQVNRKWLEIRDSGITKHWSLLWQGLTAS